MTQTCCSSALYSLYNPVLFYSSSEEHYCIVKDIMQISSHPESLTWVRLCDEGLTDVWCAGAWLHTVKVDTPSERVSTSARHVSAQEFRRCRETFPSTSETFSCPRNAPFNFNLLGFIICIHAGVVSTGCVNTCTNQNVRWLSEMSDVPSGENVQKSFSSLVSILFFFVFFVFVCKLFENK